MVRLPRSLKLFWCGVGVVAVVGFGVLQYLGPVQPAPRLPPRSAGITIPDPSKLLQIASKVNPHWQLPHIGPYGVAPMRYYAARSTAAAGQPQVAIMIAGIGDALATGNAVVKDLPPQISLAFSPYGAHDAVIAAAARTTGHELLLGLPMEVAGGPAITAGDKALRAGGMRKHNTARLDWSLSRVTGYVGVTDTIGMSTPELYLTHVHAAQWLARRLSRAGVFMVVTRPQAAALPGVIVHQADAVIPSDASVAAETAALNQLALVASAKGQALGVLETPNDAEITGLAAWCKSLSTAHVALVPVSALTAQ